MQLLGCMFNTNLSTLGLFLPVTAAIIIGVNIVFAFIWIRKNRNKKAIPVRKDIKKSPPKN